MTISEKLELHLYDTFGVNNDGSLRSATLRFDDENRVWYEWNVADQATTFLEKEDVTGITADLIHIYGNSEFDCYCLSVAWEEYGEVYLSSFPIYDYEM